MCLLEAVHKPAEHYCWLMVIVRKMNKNCCFCPHTSQLAVHLYITNTQCGWTGHVWGLSCWYCSVLCASSCYNSSFCSQLTLDQWSIADITVPKQFMFCRILEIAKSILSFCRFLRGMQEKLTEPYYFQTVDDSMKVWEQRDEPTEYQKIGKREVRS